MITLQNGKIRAENCKSEKWQRSLFLFILLHVKQQCDSPEYMAEAEKIEGGKNGNAGSNKCKKSIYDKIWRK